jgi:hypothetical protein
MPYREGEQGADQGGADGRTVHQVDSRDETRAHGRALMGNVENVKMNNYDAFLQSKRHEGDMHGFEPLFMPSMLFDFQKHLVAWATQKGRCALFWDCGLGKTAMQLVWAENIVRKTNGRVLILAPLAVTQQTLKEGGKFGVECHRSKTGELDGKIIVTNYQRLRHFKPEDFVGCVCDESSILKNYDGEYKAEITQFMRKMSYRLLCTATAAPNDYIELGTSSEALGELGFMDMLTRYFKNDTNPTVDTKRRYAAQGGEVPKWRFKQHAEKVFWRWVCSWARAVRKPSDLGFDDGRFVLPPLVERDHVVNVEAKEVGLLFQLPAVGLFEQRQERRRSINERCEMAAQLARGHDASVLWCHLNPEGDLLESLLPGCVQVCGHQSDDEKEEKLIAFLSGQSPVLVTKPMCAGFGLNMQHCAHMTFFPSHSYEQYYQSVRRCWRFGQKRPVTVDIVTTEGEQGVMRNLQKKAAAADKMFSELVSYMDRAISVQKGIEYVNKMEVPSWL